VPVISYVAYKFSASRTNIVFFSIAAKNWAVRQVFVSSLET